MTWSKCPPTHLGKGAQVSNYAYKVTQWVSLKVYRLLKCTDALRSVGCRQTQQAQVPKVCAWQPESCRESFCLFSERDKMKAKATLLWEGAHGGWLFAILMAAHWCPTQGIAQPVWDTAGWGRISLLKMAFKEIIPPPYPIVHLML